MDDMKIESSAFQNNENIPAKYTCDGANVNPPLKISGIPENTRSLVLVVDDPDAPKINSVEEIPAHTIASAELIGLYQRSIS